jgi:hypothetical protein
MRKKEFFLLVLFAAGIICSLLFLRFYSLNEFNFRNKLAKYSIFGYTLAASSNNVDLNVDVHGAPPGPSPSGGISPTGPTPSGSFTPGPSQSGSLGPSTSGSIGPSISPGGSASGTPGPSFFPGLPGLSDLLLFSNKVGIYNLILSLILLLGPALASILTAIIDPFAAFPTYFYYLWLMLLQVLGIKKRGKEWGVVYDYVSKQAVSLAIVRVVDSTTNQIKDTCITSKSGAFAFLVEEGSYNLKVFKSGYRFPLPELALGDNSRWIPGRTDGQYENIYTGGLIMVKNEDAGQINCNIPIEFSGESTYAKWFSQDSNFFATLKRVLSFIRIPIIILGSFIAIIALIAQFSILNIVVIIVYIILWCVIVFRTYTGTRAFGRVIDSSFEIPVDLVMVRLIKIDENGKASVKEVKATDGKGRFMMVAPKGRYYLTAMKPGYRGYRSQIFKIANERLIDFDLRLKKINN